LTNIADNNVSNEYFKNFDHDVFWDIMRKWSKNNIVFISERNAPNDFISVWEKEYKISFLNNSKKKNVKKIYNEQLFMYKNYFNVI
jgi:NADPH-dependent 7-cyano-7-deazaguanine reductase QueF-like protein